VESSQIQKNLWTPPGQKLYFCLDLLSCSRYEKNFFEESEPKNSNLEPCMFWFNSEEQYNILKKETEGIYLQSREFQEKISQLVSGIIILDIESDIKTSKVGTGADFAITKSYSHGMCNSYKFMAESVVEVEKWVYYIESLLSQWFYQEKDLKTNAQRYPGGSDQFPKAAAMDALESNKEQMHGSFHKLRLSEKQKGSMNQECRDQIFKDACRSQVV